MLNKRFVPALCLLALMGCASAPQVALLTYETEPPGAVLYEGGKSLGGEPVTRSYSLAEGAATVRTPEVTAVWPSGAKATFWTELRRGADDMALIQRPASAPGLDKDKAHAATVLEARRKGEQRNAQEVRSDMARQSTRCREQMATGVGAAVSNCQ